MIEILEQINSAGLRFVESALPMLVQSSLLILILLLADFALRKKLRAVFRYWIWLLVLLKLLLPTSLSSPLSLGYFFGDELAYVDIAQITEEPQVTVVDPTPASVPPFIDLTNIETYRHTPTVPPIIPDTEPAVTEPIKPPVVSVTPITWQGIVFLLWLAVVMAMGLLLLQRANFVRGLVAQSKEANGAMKDTFVHCCERMGVKRKIGLKVSANATSPAVCGLFRPVILVPRNLPSNLSANQLQAVLLHELAHIRRSDLWVNLAQTVLQIIYFYNPLLWLANCIIRRIREQAVDEMVLVAMGERARQYPQTLVNVAKMAFKRPALSLRLIGVVESKNALAGRIKHILNRPMPKRAKLGILGLAVVIITAAILLPMATCTPGPPSLVIKGTVNDAQTGEPIAGARVFDDGYGPKPDWEQIKANVRSEWGAITNSAGEYSFLTWPEHHSIKVQAPGYKAERRSLYSGHFVFNKKDEETFDFILEPEKATDSSEFKTKLPNGVTAELSMEKAKNKGSFSDKDLLIKFTELREGAAEKVSVDDMTIWSKSYEVEFAPGEDMLVAAEVYQAGKPMRILGRKIFARSNKPEKLTLTFVRNYKNVARTSITYNIKFQLGRQVFKIPEFPIYTARYFSGEAWDWYRGEGLRSLKTRHTNEEYAGIEPLFHYCSLGRERESEDQARFWIPGSNVTPILSNHCVVLKMIPLSKLKYLSVEPVGGYQGLDGKIIPPTNFTFEKANEIADAYKNMIGEYIVHQEPNNDFTATLPNGVTVELVGICEHPSDGKQWWRPDGSVLEEAPSENLRLGGFDTKESEAAYELVVKVKGPKQLENRSDTPDRWKVPQARKVGLGRSGKFKDKSGKPSLRATTAIVKRGLDSIDVTFGIGWQVKERISVSSGEKSKQRDDNIGIVVDPPYEKNGKPTVTIKIPNKTDEKMKVGVRAVLKDGSIQGYSGWSRNSKFRFMASVDNYEFAGITFSEVDHFEIFTIDYQWVEFKNVSLKPNFKSDLQVEVGNTDTIDWVIEDYGQTKLLSQKEIIETDNWVSIMASAVKNNGRYLVPDSGLTLKGLIKAAGYNRDKLAESHVELIRRSRQGNITALSIYSRNLKTLLSGEESDIVIKPNDAVLGGYIEASANAGDFWGQYSFGDVVELTVNDDGAKINMFADLDTGKLVTPPDTLNNNDENAVFRWIKDNGIDVMGETADSVRGLAGFNMFAARVDNYFWDADPVDFTDRLLIKINEPVLLSVENLLPVTYLINTTEHKMGILQILGFAEKPKGIKIRYKLLNKENTAKIDVQGEAEEAKSKTPQPFRNSIGPARRYFSRVNVRQTRDKELVKTLREDTELFEERVGFLIRDYDDGVLHGIDFDENRIVRVPDELDINDRDAILKWSKEHNIDALFRRASSLMSLNMASTIISEPEWSELSTRTLEILNKRVPGSTDILYSASGEYHYYAFKTSQGRIGVLGLASLENNGLDHRLLSIKYKLLKTDVQVEAEWVEAVSGKSEVGSVSVIRAVDNKATLAGGLTVELIGLTKIPIKDNPWWKPDGSPVDEPPFHRVGTVPSVDPNWEQFNYYAVATRLKGKPADKLGQTKWRFRGANGYAQTAYSNENILAGCVRFPKHVKTTTLHLGIVGGQWETLIAFKDYGSYRKDKDSIAVSRPYGPYGPLGSAPEEKGLYIRVVYNVTDRDVRIVAVDKNGKVHLSSSGGSGGTDDIRRTIANFRDLTQEKLREYRFQVRGYEWVEFEDIALRTGKEAIALAEQRRAKRQQEIEKWLGQGQTRQVRQQILVLRESYLYHINEPSLPQVETISAMQGLVRIGKPAVPELIAELRRTENWMTKSLIAFVLRAIGDRRAVPGLIEVLGRSKYRGGYGIYVKDDKLAEFMLDNQYYPPDESDRKVKQIIIAGPVIEIVKTLEKITGHSEGPERFSPEAAEVVKSRWQKWWEQNKDTVISRHEKATPAEQTDVQVEEESFSDFQVSDESKKFGAVDFERYFVNSEAGGLTLDQLWDDKNKDLRDADEILEIIRKGLRRYSGSGNILRWIGNLFIWGKNPQNEKAIELMYHASGSPNRGLYGDAIYFGLSVTKNKTPEILQAMVAVAMKTDDYYNVTGRILWGCRNQKDELIACLDPYLNSDDISIRQKAQDVKNYFMDSKAFMAKRAKEHEESVQQEYGNKLGQFKDKLLKGDSQTRLDTLKQLSNKGIMSIVDVSFLDAFQACIKDSDPEVRTTAARIMGSKFIWSGEPQNTQAIEILAELLEDPDRSTRGAAVYYGLSTVRNPSKELIRKMLITILDDREINYYGRVIWGIRRNKQACVEILKEWMNQSEQDNQRAVKAYEIYEDVSAKQLPDEYAQRFAGQKSNAYEGLVAICFHAKPVSKEKLQKQFLEHLANGSLMQKVLDFYIIETRETAVGMFTCDNLADRNAIRDALTKDKVFQVAGYMHGKIGPTGSGWVDSLQKFRKRNELNRVSLPKPDVQVETEKPQSLIFHGLDLTAVPHTTNSSRLPDLFEERPLGSKSYHIQKDVTAIYSGLDGTVYFIPGRNIFYVQHDKLGSSTLTYYGPFEGNPVQVLNLQSDVQAEVERSDKSSESKSSRQAVEKLPEMRGRVYGVVVNSVTGEPIAGAYVGVGDFGDSGGSNYSRHRQQGLYAKAQTDEEGRFVLEGVAFRDDHPLVVTHPEFVRHDMKVAVQRGGPEPEIKVSLRPAAKINVTVVDSNDKPLEGFWLVRLEALDGRYFIPPGRDRHLSSFASSIWIELPKPKMKPDKKSLSGTAGFSFTELDSGEYSIDVIKFTITDNYTPPPAGMVRLPLDTSNITYYGGIANLKIETGQAKEVAIKPANYQTSITIKMPDDPVKKPHIPPFVFISRNVGLLLWNDGKAHGPEDHRLGRLQKNALYYNMVVDGDVLTIKNLPPGSYSVFAGPIYFMNAVRMKVLSGREVTVEIPVIQLSEHAKVGLWTFDRKVKPEAGSYSVSDLCELISAKTGSNPRIIAEASIQNEKLKLSEREMSVWDLLETLYLEKGWKLKEGAKKTLVLYPADKADVQAERETNNRAELNAAPVEIQAIGKVLKEWFENCAAGDLEEVKKAYLPSLNKKAERDLQQIERFLEVVPDWQFSLLGVMWDGNKATAVSNVLKGLKDPAAIISGLVVWICHLNKLDGQWRLANNVVGERMEIVQTFITQAKQKNPNLRIWPENFSTHLFQETNVLKKEAKVFEEGHWEQLDGAPKEVQDIGEVLRRWFGGCLAGDLEQVKATYTPNNRKRAEKQLKEIREYMTITPADWQFSPMIIKIGDSRAEAISHEFVITFNHPENTGDPAVLIVHLMKVDAQWGILYSSGDLLRNVSYAHFKRKYPQSRIWFDKSIPDWLKPDQETNTDITIGDIKSGLPETKTEETLAEKLRELNNDKTVFESYFPDSVEGGKALDDWWQRRSKDPDIDNKIFSMVRYGLRRNGKGNPRKYNRDLYIKWIGQKYIWKKGPKNKQAVELMYYASFDPGLTGDVVYNGLSVAGPEQNPKILKRLVDICMIDTSVTRILWGTKGKHDRMIEYLEPYLNSLDQQIRQRAIILEKAFKGEIDYGQWEKEQYRKKRQEEFGDQLSQIREVLLKGNSKQRSEMFGLIKRKGLYILVDDSFKEPLIACLKDDHPVVKEAALRLSGGVLLKKNEQSPDIFELMSNLSNDWDHKVRNEAAKFIGSHWIWGVKPQKPEAIEIMLRLSKDKDRGVRYQAVYYGLSVVENKDERIVKRLVEMALDKTNDFGRISWGLSRGADKKMIKKQLKPYLGLESKKSELARQLYKEIFKEELPEI